MGRTVGLALGGGGARGLAHALVLEALDELGCRPSLIAGTSMGAVMGALYASGVPGRAIRENIQKYVISRDETWRDLFKRRSDFLTVIKAVGFERGHGALVKPDRFLNFLLATVHRHSFADLDLPLLVIATDYWTGEEVVLRTGPLLPALKASIAIPGVFPPVSIGNRMLLDGGIVNLVPYEHILGRCDVSIAVNVSGLRTPSHTRPPAAWESMLGSIQIMQEATLAEKLKRSRPDLWVRPDIDGVPLLAFGKAARVLRQAGPAVAEMKAALRKLL